MMTMAITTPVAVMMGRVWAQPTEGARREQANLRRRIVEDPLDRNLLRVVELGCLLEVERGEEMLALGRREERRCEQQERVLLPLPNAPRQE